MTIQRELMSRFPGGQVGSVPREIPSEPATGTARLIVAPGVLTPHGAH